MKIQSVRIRNFRGFEDETFHFDPHTCQRRTKSAALAGVKMYYWGEVEPIHLVRCRTRCFGLSR